MIVKSRITDMLKEGDDFFISDIVVDEAYFALQHFYSFSKESSIAALRAIAAEPGFALSPEATAALSTPGVWKANPGFIDRVLASEYAAKGLVTLCFTSENIFRPVKCSRST